MPRTIYLAIFSNDARGAHYAIFVPTGDAGEEGKLIHITGNKATGFFLQFKRNYNFDGTRRKYQVIPLAEIDEKFVKDTPGNGDKSNDTTGRDRLESVAFTVPPPGPNPNPFDPSAPGCQHWLRSYVNKLVEDGLIAESAVSVVQNAPKRL